jgi:hypothetical protein
MKKLSLVLMLCASGAFLRADFTYTETSQVTGGAMYEMSKNMPFMGKLREPMISTHILKGNRMAMVMKDNITITDLDKETVTTIDLAKKTYSVMTFEQMKQAMDDAMKRMKGKKEEKEDAMGQAQFKMNAKATGQTRTIQGLNAKEMLVTMSFEGTDTKTGQKGGMDMNMDTWYAPLPGYGEVKEYQKRMAVKFGYIYGSGMAQIAQMQQMQGGNGADIEKNMEAMAKEMAKIDGAPVEMVMKMVASGMDANASAANTSRNSPPPARTREDKQPESAGSAVAGAITGRLPGGFGGFGRKKANKDDQPEPAASSSSAPATGADGKMQSGSLMEMTTTLTSFSSTADASKFDIPAGFKQVEPDMRRAGAAAR